MELVRLLQALEGDRRIIVHEDSEFAFQTECREGRVDVICLLLAL